VGKFIREIIYSIYVFSNKFSTLYRLAGFIRKNIYIINPPTSVYDIYVFSNKSPYPYPHIWGWGWGEGDLLEKTYMGVRVRVEVGEFIRENIYIYRVGVKGFIRENIYITYSYTKKWWVLLYIAWMH